MISQHLQIKERDQIKVQLDLINDAVDIEDFITKSMNQVCEQFNVQCDKEEAIFKFKNDADFIQRCMTESSRFHMSVE